jgi:MSHA biogenesis protein MshQ
MRRNLLRAGWLALLATISCAAHAAPHFVIMHSGYGIYCAPATITVYVRDTNENPDTTYAQTMVIDTGSGAGNWSLVSGAGTLSNGAANDGIATYSWPGGQSSATFALSYPSGVSMISVSAHQQNDSSVHDNGIGTASGGTGPLQFALGQLVLSSTPFPAGAITNLPTFASPQVAGASVTLYITAYGQTTSGGACGILTTHTGNVTVTQSFVNPTTGTRQLTPPTLKLAAGKTSTVVAYKDVGSIRFSANEGALLGGATGSIVYTPYNFKVTSILRTSDNFANPAAAATTGKAFIAAGDPFTVTVAAYEKGGMLAPNYGQETPAELVGLQTELLALANAPRATHNPEIAATVGFRPFSGGSSTGTDFTWPEVGIIKITPHVADGNYLDAGDTMGTKTANVGRFYAAKFVVTQNTPLFATACGSGGFTYAGQPFKFAVNPELTVVAQTRSGVATTNYSGGFMKLTGSTLKNRNYVESHAPVQTALPTLATDVTITDNGGGNVTVALGTGMTATKGLMMPRTTATAPYDAKIALDIDVIDADGATPLKADDTTDNPVVIGSGPDGIGFDVKPRILFGRLAFTNAYGPEVADLVVPLHVNYYVSDAAGYGVNADDACTALTQQPTIKPAAFTTAYPMTLSPTGGKFDLILHAPNKTGSVTVTQVAPVWLEYPWTATTKDPTGLATFGTYKGNQHRIYQREP